MKFFAFCLLLSFPVVFSACAPSRVSTPPPPLPTSVIETEAPAPVAAPEITTPPPVVALEPTTTAPEPRPAAPVATPALSDSISEKRLERALEPKTLLQIIREAGVPDDNLTPGRKEQIAVYQREGKFQFYLFQDSRLVAWGEYPRSMITQMQQQRTYPQDVVRDFNQLLQ